MARGWLLGLGALGLGGCGGGAGVLGPPPCDLDAGAVLWTALAVAPPAGAREWLTLRNPGPEAVSLQRAVVTVAGAGGEMRRWALSGTLAAGAHLRLDGTRLPGLSLSDAGGVVALSCRGRLVHRVRWSAVARETVLRRDAAAPPAREDVPDWWCAGAGGVCGLAFCEGAAGPRPVRAARVRLSEVMADPEGRDAGREWVELVARSAGDLNGLTLRFEDEAGRVRQWRLADGRCLAVTPGARRVVGLGTQAPPPRWHGPGLPNGAGRLRLLRDGAVLDEVALPAARVGRSWSLDEATGTWCAGRGHPQAAVAASPGEANAPCGAVCWSGEGWRRQRAPAPGAVVLSELLADPEGRDAGREWVELYNAGDAPVDLNGVHVSVQARASGRTRGPWPLAPGPACVSLEPGAYGVWGGEAVTLPVRPLSGLALYNEAMRLWLTDAAGVLLDEAWVPAPVSGRSWAVAPGAGAADNDSPTAWCAQRTLAADGSRATPGAANEPCGAWCRGAAGQWRRWRPPQAGEVALVGLGQTAAGEWLALRSLAARAVDLNGLWLVQQGPRGGVRQWRLEAAACLSLPAGVLWRLGAAGVVEVPGLDLYLGTSRWVLRHGEVTVDEAQAPLPRGAVVGVPGLDDPWDNDEAAAWCEGCAP